MALHSFTLLSALSSSEDGEREVKNRGVSGKKGSFVRKTRRGNVIRARRGRKNEETAAEREVTIACFRLMKECK